jgi:two-component system, OmpR family, response regulator
MRMESYPRSCVIESCPRSRASSPLMRAHTDRRDRPPLIKSESGAQLLLKTARLSRILVADSDVEMQRVATEYLRERDVEVCMATSRVVMQRLLSVGNIDIIVLNIRLGSSNSGLEILRDLRACSDIPVIITGCHETDRFDCVTGLEIGADDYLIKPLSLPELLARIRGVLRRRNLKRIDPPLVSRSDKRRFGGWIFDGRTGRLMNPAGVIVRLTKGEYALLHAFLDAPQRPLSREYLLQATRVHEDLFDRSIDVQISRLRRKLEADPATPNLIKTERGFGYTFTTHVASAG